MENPSFLKEKYDLHKASEVESAAERTEAKTGEKVPQKPEARIQNYLDRLERLTLDPEKKQPKSKISRWRPDRPRALSLLREMVMDRYVRPNKEKMAEGAARVEERAARELGIEAHYGEQELEQLGEIAVEDLEKSLDEWIKYLSDANEPYPTWFRYYVFRNILDLGDYDKDKGEFTKRSEGTVRLFPEVDRGALGFVQERMEAAKDPEMLGKIRRGQIANATPEDQLITKEKAANFAKLSFAKQYAEGIKQAGEITTEMREETRGKWAKYQKGTDPTALWASLQNKGTAWCTKGFGTAETQLKSGDFYVYYTLDRQGKPTIPRIAIRMQGDSIAEVRGVADNDQNLEGNMVDVANIKMNELPGAEKYLKASADMKRLTLIDKKTKAGQELTKDDLVFLYEIDSTIEGFGYQKDQRIKELRDKRDPKRDAPIVLDCKPEEVAGSKKDINDDTKAFIGQLEPGIFEQLKDIENIYTKFPNKRIIQMELIPNLELSTPAGYEKALKNKGHQISDWAKDILYKMPVEKAESLDLVILSVADLGLERGGTTDEVYTQAKKLCLELCPAWVGPQLRLDYTEQPLGEYIFIGMEQIADRDRYPLVFSVARDSDGSWLYAYYARPDDGWYPGYRFVFVVPRK